MRRRTLAVGVLVAILFALGAGTGLVLSSRSANRPQSSTSGASARENRNLSILQPGGDDPLGVGESVDASVAMKSIEDCADCPHFNRGSAVDVSNVTQAWYRGNDGAIALDYESGLRVYLYPDARDPSSYAKGAVAADRGETELGPPLDSLGLEYESVGAVPMVGLEASKNSPSSLSWIEGGYMVELIGHGGQSLETLTSIAQSMV
jgi:hypothetical protein